MKFETDYYICGNYFKCAWAIREYANTTEEQAILSHLADKTGVTLRIYNRPVEPGEIDKIIQSATSRNKFMAQDGNISNAIAAEGNLSDVYQILSECIRNKEALLHTAVYLELEGRNLQELRELQDDVSMELKGSKIVYDCLFLRQQEGFLSLLPFGSNAFGSQFERILPASSVANLYPLNYSGKTDEKGFYIGRDKYGTNIFVDLDKRTNDKTNCSILILGNSGQGKSYLFNLILINLLESGKCGVLLDPEAERLEMTESLGGTYIDLMTGEYLINPLEPKCWGFDNDEETEIATFNQTNLLLQHVSYLKDFFRAYKDFTDAELDTIEIMLLKLYKNFGIDEDTDLSGLKSTDYPIMSDFYAVLIQEFENYNSKGKQIYTEKTLQNICLGIYSMCNGAEKKYFNGYTNLKDERLICFGVKGLLDTNKRLKDAMLFNILSFMSNMLLVKGGTIAGIDELYLFLTNSVAIEYIRNAMKRVRKRDSGLLLASQNIEDFLLEGIKELTKPLFSIPAHQFLFNPGTIDARTFCDTLSLESSEYDLIKYPERGSCLYRCGNERYLLQVHAPRYKEKYFGTAGGR